MDRASLGPLSCLVRRNREGGPVLVALHGRGASAEDLADLGDMIDPELNQVYPDAPRNWSRCSRAGTSPRLRRLSITHWKRRRSGSIRC